MEAISHIDPAENFLKSAYESLNMRGCLVISDSHLLNPYMQWRLFKIRKRRDKYTFKVLDDGRVIPYADERLFAVTVLTRLMRKSGFTKIMTQLSIFFPPYFMKHKLMCNLIISIDKFLNKIPLNRQIGGICTVIGYKD